MPISEDFSITSTELADQFVEHRVADPRILRRIQKWFNAGVIEEGEWSNTKTGSPQVR